MRYAEAPTGRIVGNPDPSIRERNIRRMAARLCAGRRQRDWYKIVAKGVGADPNVIFDTPPTSEDCLFLNIWQPLSGDLSDLPVMVWIHGGGNVGGWAYEPNYIGAELASEGVIVVSIGYRLGVFGFLAHPHYPRNLLMIPLAIMPFWIRLRHSNGFSGISMNTVVTLKTLPFLVSLRVPETSVIFSFRLWRTTSSTKQLCKAEDGRLSWTESWLRMKR